MNKIIALFPTLTSKDIRTSTVGENGKFSMLDKKGKSHKLNTRDMKKYKSGKEKLPDYFIEFLDSM